MDATAAPVSVARPSWSARAAAWWADVWDRPVAPKVAERHPDPWRRRWRRMLVPGARRTSIVGGFLALLSTLLLVASIPDASALTAAHAGFVAQALSLIAALSLVPGIVLHMPALYLSDVRSRLPGLRPAKIAFLTGSSGIGRLMLRLAQVCAGLTVVDVAAHGGAHTAAVGFVGLALSWGLLKRPPSEVVAVLRRMLPWLNPRWRSLDTDSARATPAPAASRAPADDPSQVAPLGAAATRRARWAWWRDRHASDWWWKRHNGAVSLLQVPLMVSLTASLLTVVGFFDARPNAHGSAALLMRVVGGLAALGMGGLFVCCIAGLVSLGRARYRKGLRRCSRQTVRALTETLTGVACLCAVPPAVLMLCAAPTAVLAPWYPITALMGPLGALGAIIATRRVWPAQRRRLAQADTTAVGAAVRGINWTRLSHAFGGDAARACEALAETALQAPASAGAPDRLWAKQVVDTIAFISRAPNPNNVGGREAFLHPLRRGRHLPKMLSVTPVAEALDAHRSHVLVGWPRLCADIRAVHESNAHLGSDASAWRNDLLRQVVDVGVAHAALGRALDWDWERMIQALEICTRVEVSTTAGTQMDQEVRRDWARVRNALGQGALLGNAPAAAPPEHHLPVAAPVALPTEPPIVLVKGDEAPPIPSRSACPPTDPHEDAHGRPCDPPLCVVEGFRAAYAQAIPYPEASPPPRDL